MRVAGDDHVVAARGGLRRGVGGVHDREPEPSGRSSGQEAEVLPLDVGVVEPQELDRKPVERDLATDVREILPPIGTQKLRQIGATTPSGMTRKTAAPEVLEGVERSGHVQVVGSENEPRRKAPARRTHCRDRGLDRVGFSEEVARHDRDVGLRERREEASLRGVFSAEVQVRQVQHGERRPHR